MMWSEELKIPNRRAAGERKVGAPHRYANATAAVPGLIAGAACSQRVDVYHFKNRRL